MTEKYKLIKKGDNRIFHITDSKHILTGEELVKLLNEQDNQVNFWKENAMTLLLQVRRLLPRMSDKEIAEYSKELEKIQDER